MPAATKGSARRQPAGSGVANPVAAGAARPKQQPNAAASRAFVGPPPPTNTQDHTKPTTAVHDADNDNREDDAAGATLKDLCGRDKRKVARLIQQVVSADESLARALASERSALESRLSRLRAQNDAFALETAALRAKLAAAYAAVRAYQGRDSVKESAEASTQQVRSCVDAEAQTNDDHQHCSIYTSNAPETVDRGVDPVSPLSARDTTTSQTQAAAEAPEHDEATTSVPHAVGEVDSGGCDHTNDEDNTPPPQQLQPQPQPPPPPQQQHSTAPLLSGLLLERDAALLHRLLAIQSGRREREVDSPAIPTYSQRDTSDPQTSGDDHYVVVDRRYLLAAEHAMRPLSSDGSEQDTTTPSVRQEEESSARDLHYVVKPSAVFNATPVHNNNNNNNVMEGQAHTPARAEEYELLEADIETPWMEHLFPQRGADISPPPRVHTHAHAHIHSSLARRSIPPALPEPISLFELVEALELGGSTKTKSANINNSRNNNINRRKGKVSAAWLAVAARECDESGLAYEENDVMEVLMELGDGGCDEDDEEEEEEDTMAMYPDANTYSRFFSSCVISNAKYSPTCADDHSP
eukprot:jgi/Chlat1/7439/Chrsp6S07495